MVAYPYNPSNWEEAEGTHESEANLVYLVSSRLDRATQRDTVYKNNNKTRSCSEAKSSL